MHPAPAPDWFLFYKPALYPFIFWYPPLSPEGHSVEVYEDGAPHTRILKCRSIEGNQRHLKVDWHYETSEDQSAAALDLKQPMPNATLGGRDARHFSFRTDSADLATYQVLFGRQLCELTYPANSRVSQQILANIAFHDHSAPPAPPASEPSKPLVPRTDSVGWLLFSSAGLPVQFHYPRRTPMGAQVSCHATHLSKWDNVSCQSVGTDEFYLGVTIYAAGDQNAQFFATGMGGRAVTPITPTTIGGRAATSYDIQAGTVTRTVYVIRLGDKLCTVIYDTAAPVAQQVAATLEFV